jgi:hypothetical protein
LTATPPANPFFRYMSIIVLVGGLVWLGFALYNARGGGSFNWGGLTGFLLLLAGFTIAGSRRGAARR